MSDMRAFGWRIARQLLAASVAWGAVSGQTVADYTHRADSLARIWKTATREQASRDSLQRSRVPGDTLHVGNFVIATDSTHAALARAAAERVSPTLDRAYGTFATHLRSHTFILRSRTPRAGETVESAIESGILDAQGVVRFGSQEFATPEALARSWNGKAAEMLSQDLPPTVREWLNQAIPTEEITLRDLDNDRIELILSASEAAHDCSAGAVPRCSQALGITPVAEPAFALFNQNERRDMIERNANRFRRSDPVQYSRCTIDRVQATCDSIVRAIPIDAVAFATPPSVRRSIVRYALQLGGPGAFDRFASTDGTIGDRLSAAAKAPIDSVIRRWHTALMSSRAASNAMSLETATSAIIWAAACCALALRSSRWR